MKNTSYTWFCCQEENIWAEGKEPCFLFAPEISFWIFESLLFVVKDRTASSPALTGKMQKWLWGFQPHPNILSCAVDQSVCLWTACNPGLRIATVCCTCHRACWLTPAPWPSITLLFLLGACCSGNCKFYNLKGPWRKFSPGLVILGAWSPKDL